MVHMLQIVNVFLPTHWMQEHHFGIWLQLGITYKQPENAHYRNAVLKLGIYLLH